MLQKIYMIKKMNMNDEFTFDVLCKMSDLVINGKRCTCIKLSKRFLSLLLDETWKLKKLLSKSVSSAFWTLCVRVAGALGEKF